MDLGSITGLRKIAILSGLMLVIFITFYYALWRPGLTELKMYQMDLNKKATELVQLEKDAKDWPDTITREMINRYEDKLEMLWELIPTEEGLSLLLDEVENHAVVCGLEIVSLEREDDSRARVASRAASGQAIVQTDESRYQKALYKIKTRGSYFGLVKFIRNLEESERLITISKIETNSNSLADPLQWGYTIEAEVDFNIYYSKVGVEKA